MADAVLKYFTFEEFLTWNPEGDTRYELIDGHPVAMAPSSPVHQIIAGNVIRRLAEALDHSSPCSVRAEAGIRPVHRTDSFFQADVAVSCVPPGPGDAMTRDPTLIVEILSPSTEDHDRKVKVPGYRAIPSVREIVLIDQTPFFCEVLRRIEGDRWLTELVLRPEARLRLDSVGLEIPLSLLYANVPLPEADAEVPPEHQDAKAT